jgi:hypothetical protein
MTKGAQEQNTEDLEDGLSASAPVANSWRTVQPTELPFAPCLRGGTRLSGVQRTITVRCPVRRQRND